MFNRGVFFEGETRFSSENAAIQNFLLSTEKTLVFNQSVSFEGGTRFSSEYAALHNSCFCPNTTFLSIHPHSLVLWATSLLEFQEKSSYPFKTLYTFDNEHRYFTLQIVSIGIWPK